MYVGISVSDEIGCLLRVVPMLLKSQVEEQPRKLESVIQVSQNCLQPHDKDANKDSNKEAPKETNKNIAELVQDLVFNENILLQTLGFDVAVDHPHTHVIKTCQLVKGLFYL